MLQSNPVVSRPSNGTAVPPRTRNWVKQVVAQVPAVLTLGAIGILALWGWYNDWRLSASRSDKEPSAKEAAAEPAVKVFPASPSPTGDSDGSPAWGSSRIEFPSIAAVKKVGIQVERVRVQELTRVVTAPGMADYEHGLYVRLTARASGSVLRVEKELGDSVRKGDILALLDAAEVGRIKAELLQDLAQAQLRASTLARLQDASKKGTMISERDLQAAQISLREARIRVANGEQALLNLGLPVRLAELEKLSDDQIARRLRLLGLSEDIARELDPETLTANLLPLIAPFDGLVVERSVAVGEVVQTMQPKTLFVVGDVRRLHIDLDVNPEDMGEVRVGQQVIFQPNDAGPAVVASLSHISPEVNEKTRRVQVHAEFRNENGRLRPNTFGTGRIVVAKRPSATVISSDAVQAHGDVSLVFVQIAPTSFEARPVRTGVRQGSLVEVSGVQEGEPVVTVGSHQLKSELQKDRIVGGDE